MFQITTVACLTCLCTSGTVKVGLFMLPLVGRLRLMMFVTLLSLFVTSLLLFLDISHIVYLFPFNWGKVVSKNFIYISTFLVTYSRIYVSECMALCQHQCLVSRLFISHIPHDFCVRFFLMGTKMDAPTVTCHRGKIY